MGLHVAHYLRHHLRLALGQSLGNDPIHLDLGVHAGAILSWWRGGAICTYIGGMGPMPRSHPGRDPKTCRITSLSDSSGLSARILCISAYVVFKKIITDVTYMRKLYVT
jgi:hypothetical protein